MDGKQQNEPNRGLAEMAFWLLILTIAATIWLTTYAATHGGNL